MKKEIKWTLIGMGGTMLGIVLGFAFPLFSGQTKPLELTYVECRDQGYKIFSGYVTDLTSYGADPSISFRSKDKLYAIKNAACMVEVIKPGQKL